MNVIRRIWARLKKYIWIVLAVPVILGGIGWFIPAAHDSSSYQASATLSLGMYWNNDYNTPEPVIQLLTNGPFYQNNLPELWNNQKQSLLSHLNVTSLKGNLIQLTYSGASKVNAAATVNRIAQAFLKSDQERYQTRRALTDQTIQAVNQSKTNGNTDIDRERFLYQLGSDKLKMKPATLLEQATAGTGQGSNTFSPKKRAVLGIMLGLTLVFLWAVFPEFVREKEEGM
ncbi:hydrolase [Sporolactobacillus pectinivorans]|uniref:hydrolase n=1 Tax=Sporolactobacillus pectinivorans TaxID=1591408 RepID=UPI000C26883E|nr:hydrolase [Sporolactobacillus pectinivorans]